jgi:hypothetical protein
LYRIPSLKLSQNCLSLVSFVTLWLVRNNYVNLDFIAFRVQCFCFVICTFCHSSNFLFLNRISSRLHINPELRSKTGQKKRLVKLLEWSPLKIVMEMVKNMILKLLNIKFLARQQHLRIYILRPTLQNKELEERFGLMWKLHCRLHCAIFCFHS